MFSMVVVDDSLYWTDWTHRAILRGSKMAGGNATVIAQTALLPYGLKAFHSSMQPEPGKIWGTLLTRFVATASSRLQPLQHNGMLSAVLDLN